MADRGARTADTYEFAARRERLAPASWRAGSAPAPIPREPLSKPGVRRPEPKPKKTDEKKTAHTYTETLKMHYIGISGGSKFAYLLLISALALLFGVIIAVSAYRTSVQDSINVAKQETAALKTEIRDLSVEIESSKIIGNIEYKAIGDLDMIYPTGAQTVYNSELELEDTEALLAKLAEMAHGQE